MAVVASDLVVYASAVMPTGDVALPGGAIDTTVKMTFTDMAATDGLVMSSNGISDEVKVDVTGRNAGGSIVTDQYVVFQSLARVSGISETAFERILKMGISSGTHTGTITIEQDNFPTWNAVGTMESGISGIQRPFYGASSAAGNAKEYFNKVFVKNNNFVNNFLSASVFESGEVGFTNKIVFDICSSGSDDGVSSTNRLGAPPASQVLSNATGSWDSAAKAVPGTDLDARSGIGVWIKLDLASSESADNGSWNIGLSGSTTS